MTTIGVVVIAADGPATARTVDSVLRQHEAFDTAVVAVGPAIDARLVVWLEALCGQQRWRLVRTPAASVAHGVNAMLASTTADWVLPVEAGDTLKASAARDIRALVADDDGSAGVAAFPVRLTGLGVDEIARGGDPRSPAAFDPAHPALRGLVWRSSAVGVVGGFDLDLPSGARYELWLRQLGAGTGTLSADTVLLDVSTDAGAPLVAEIDAPAFDASAARITARHLPLLAAHVGDVLEARDTRVSRLSSANAAALARHREGELAVSQLSVDGTAPAAPGPWRASPLSRQWGYDREGGPLDRHYIEQFLERHAGDIRGAVLEVQEADYTRRFGAAVTKSDVVDLVSENAGATILSDLRRAANIGDATYDCVILTQTLHVIPQMSEVVAECHRILRPGGVLLLTAPAVSRVCLEYGRDGDFWRLTPAGARVLVEPTFGAEVEVVPLGNAGAAAAFLVGLGRDELPAEVRAVTDIYNPALVGVRAVKTGPDHRRAPASRPGRRSGGIALLYHRIGGRDADPHSLSVPAEAFDAQMSWLSRHCAVLPLHELREGARLRALPPRAVAITFDDGYVDTLTVAAPVLAGLGLPATCFVTTEGLAGPHEFWWDALASALLGDANYPGSIALHLPDGVRELPTTTRGERLFVHGLVYHAIVGATASERSKVVADIRSWAPEPARGPEARRMTASEISELAGHGIAVGAHSVTHPLLPRLPRAEQVREIAGSRAELERIVGGPVASFAYPYGAYDKATIDAAAEAGITSAWTCEPRAMLGTDDGLSLPRVDPQTADLARFVARIEASCAHVE